MYYLYRFALLFSCLVVTGCASYRKNEAGPDLAAGTATAGAAFATGVASTPLDGGMAFMGGMAIFSSLFSFFDKLEQAQIDDCVTQAVIKCLKGEVTEGGLRCQNERWTAIIYPKLVDTAPGQKGSGVQVIIYETGPFNFVETEGGLFHPFRVAYPNSFLETYLKQKGELQ